MSEISVIVCKPTQWIKVRAVLIIAMFAVFGYLFYKDGHIGYREKNEQYAYYNLFNEVAVKKANTFESEEKWKEFVATKKIDFPNEENCPLPKDFERDQLWPEILASHYEAIKGSNKKINQAWIDYTGARGWGVEVADHPEDQGSLNTQFYMATCSAALALVMAFIFLRTLTRTMEVTESAYIAPGRKVVPFISMRRIDTRKWYSKGVATIEYEVNGVTKKVKVDGMVYGQFKKKDGEPAEKLYAFIMEHFKGEVIEFESDDENENLEESNSDDHEGENSELAQNS
ncbi:hypothetical protein [Rubritalea profundi]|uniref:Uncharacterized protein n=1 Tax=Rubritalea profundi TaxID=1658618 RepID=A0A2S7U523_9BACT|nr:hypothetical protein [Rubritalea profundi]PQJ30119.1 hypothetical protein BSZ32_17665 [Rubritalea profundi]